MNRSDAASNSITPSSVSLTPVTLGSLSIFGLAESGWPLVLRNFLPRAQYNHHARSPARSPLRFPDPSQSAPVQRRSHSFAGFRNRGQYRHFHAHPSAHSAASAGERSATTGDAGRARPPLRRKQRARQDLVSHVPGYPRQKSGFRRDVLHAYQHHERFL